MQFVRSIVGRRDALFQFLTECRRTATRICTAPPPGGWRPAFTLIEILAVLIIMGILLLLVLPDMESSHRTYLLERGAAEVVASMRFAQSHAINTGTDHGCAYLTASNSLRCFEVTGSPPYPTADHPIKKTPYSLDFDTSPGLGGLTISAATFPSETVVFDTLGSPDSGGSVTVSISGYSKIVNVAAVSGLIETADP